MNNLEKVGNKICGLLAINPKFIRNIPELAPVRNLDKRRAPYLPFAEGINESIEYRRFPKMKTTAAVIPSGLTAPILL